MNKEHQAENAAESSTTDARLPSADLAQNPLLTAVKDIEIGNRIELESGDVVKVASITKGWLHNSIFLNYSNGQWSCLLNSDCVALYGS